jgi:pimeloyl-ACP methyl ester carboxylesterase
MRPSPPAPIQPWRPRAFAAGLLVVLVLLLAGCMSRPDLARLYEDTDGRADQPPVIVIHGLAGSTLVDADSGKEVWPGSLGTLTFSNYRDLAQMSSADREGEGLVPGGLFTSVAGVDFYGQLLHSLEAVGHFKRGVPGTPVKADGSDRRRYYVLVYDWRRDNTRTVRKLHELIEQIRADYGDPDLRVDVVAHSNGGLIANYYLRYGPRDVLDEVGTPAGPQPWDEGGKRIRRLVMLGTPTLGSSTSLERLIVGMKMAVRTIPVEVMATFVTPYQALPHPLDHPILDVRGQPVHVDIYDPRVWRERQWGVYAPDTIARVLDSMDTPEAGRQALRDLHARFDLNLDRARRWQWALSAPPPATDVEVAVFGGDCADTPGHAVEIEEAGGTRLAFRPGQVDPHLVPAQPGTRQIKLDFQRLMFEPGDGLITRRSQVGKLPADAEDAALFHPLPVQQTFFLCESHGRLTHNAYFQNNLLYFLLAR